MDNFVGKRAREEESGPSDEPNLKKAREGEELIQELTIFYWNLMNFKRFGDSNGSEINNLLKVISGELKNAHLHESPDIIIIGEYFIKDCCSINKHEIGNYIPMFVKRYKTINVNKTQETCLVLIRKGIENIITVGSFVYHKDGPSESIGPSIKAVLHTKNNKMFECIIRKVHVINNTKQSAESNPIQKTVDIIDLEKIFVDETNPILLLGDFNFETNINSNRNIINKLGLSNLFNTCGHRFPHITGTNEHKNKFYDNGLFQKESWKDFLPHLIAVERIRSKCDKCNREFSDHSWLYFKICPKK